MYKSFNSFPFSLNTGNTNKGQGELVNSDTDDQQIVSQRYILSQHNDFQRKEGKGTKLLQWKGNGDNGHTDRQTCQITRQGVKC